MSRRWMSLLLLAGLLTGCRGGQQAASSLLLEQAPVGYHRLGGERAATMTAKDAARASVADEADIAPALRRLRFVTGSSKVWQKGDFYVSALVFELGTASAARELVAVEVARAKGFVGTFTFAVPGVADAIGYTIAGHSRREGGTLYCNTVWFARARLAFSLNDCGNAPSGTPGVIALAVRQQRFYADKAPAKG